MFGAPKKQRTPVREQGREREKEKERVSEAVARKPFVSTARRVDVFGTAAPLPGQHSLTHSLTAPLPPSTPLAPLPPVPLQRAEPAPSLTPTHSATHSHALSLSLAPPTDSTSTTSSTRMVHSAKYLQQSVRWLNLSVSLWAMIVVDANRVVDAGSLGSLLAAMSWRVHGDISEHEFTEVFREWMGRSSVEIPHKYNCSVFVLRDVLLDSHTCSQESDLDLLLGMVINENNRRLLNVPLNFNDGTARSELTVKPTLELCSRRWLALSEELFFQLDAPGFGHLAFDQFYFLAACLLLARREWVIESEAEEALSMTNLSALALQLMQEAGAKVSLTTPAADEQQQRSLERRKNSVLLRRKSMNMSSGSSLPKTSRQGSISRRPSMAENEDREKEVDEQGVVELQRKLHSGENSSVVSLAMFKALLVSRGLGEAALIALVAHVRHCCTLLATVGRNQSAALHQTCSTYGSDGAGSPRPFHRCVYSVAGWPLPGLSGAGANSHSNTGDSSAGNAMSPILLYLLSDVEGLIPGVWLAAVDLDAKHDRVDIDDNSSEVSDEQQDQMNSQFFETQREVRKFSDKLTEDVAKKLWIRFSNWGDSAFEPGSKNFFEARESIPEDEAIFREPTFRFIMSVLSEYKSILQLMNAGLVDIAMDNFGDEALRSSAAGVAASVLLPMDVASLLVDITSPLARFLDTSPRKSNPVTDFSSLQYSTVDNISNNNPFGSTSSPRQVPPALSTDELDEATSPNFSQARHSPMNLLFGSATVDSLHSKGSIDKNLDDTSTMSVRHHDKQQEQKEESAVKVTSPPQLGEEVRMEDVEGDSFANWVNTDDEGAQNGGVRMEDVESNSFANWVNTDSDVDCRDQDDTILNGNTSESSKMKVEINQATWSAVFDDGAEDSKMDDEQVSRDDNTTSRKQEVEQQLTGNNQESRSVYSNVTASDTTSQIAKREFLRNDELSDDGSPGGLNDEDISLLSQGGQGYFSQPTPGTTDRRRTRRKHRQVAKPIASPETDGDQHETKTSIHHNASRDIHQNDENEQRNRTDTFTLGQDSCSENEDMRAAKRDLLATLAAESGQTVDLDAQSVASSSSMANSVIELLERGQTAGLYAQSLRDLLRKMSRGDNNMHLKSLEKIIELGNSIVESEEEANLSLRAQRRSPPPGNNASPSKRSPHVLTSPPSTNHSGGKRTEQLGRQRQQVYGRPQYSPRESTATSVRGVQRDSAGSGSGSEKLHIRQIPAPSRGSSQGQRDRNYEKTPGTASAKKRVPGVVPSAKSRTNKQAFSM